MSDNNKYNGTMLLPKTDFGMRGKLPTEEVKMLKYWKDIGLWDKLRENSKNKKKFILHDGPPYANGPIHIGTAANKILKDIINRTMQFEGYNALYVPGWDCHGLPIEWQIEKQYRKKGKKKEDINIKDFRNECREFANKWIEEQKSSFIRLFVLADWDKPYTTMDYESEAIILQEFSKFFFNGSLYQGSKPVMWSPIEKTALAEAEIEYQDISSTSIYVTFNIKKSSSDFLENTSIVIWTTTPWTIPGNRAIAFGHSINYCVFKVLDAETNTIINKKYMVAESLLNKVCERCNIKKFTILKVIKGKELNNITCKHPFSEIGYDYDVPLLRGDFVEENEGTGFVHIAPCYGEDDYYLALDNNILVKDIVKDDGCYKEGTPIFGGIHVFKAHLIVIEKLKEFNSLLGVREYSHSYPHSWRSKKPIIFRTTPQWFISMNKNSLKDKAMQSIENTKWIPKSSKNRIYSMVENRPDWCVSRQRAWGVPLTIFVNKKTGEALKDKKVMQRIIEDVKKRGSDVWLSEDPYKYLENDYDPHDYYAVKDILDVWFDSGSSHAFVLEKNKLNWPADLYLEGTDQHRGFFQSSLLASCGTRGRAPYKSVITHGFVLDGKGRKMSKSLGNVINPEDIIKKSGADVLRLWVATTDYSDDMKIGEEVLNNLNDNYRRIRNTFRFLLGNIQHSNFDDVFEYSKLEEIDKFILARLYQIESIRKKSLKDYTFHVFYKVLFEFCSVDLSSFYFDISKDVLYCNDIDNRIRKNKVKILFKILEKLTEWYAPVICHTMEEVWQKYKLENIESIHLKQYKDIDTVWENSNILEKWEKIKKIRKTINAAIEIARNNKKLGSSLEANVLLVTKENNILKVIKDIEMDNICIISSFKVANSDQNIDNSFVSSFINNEKNIQVFVYKSNYEKCLRCWQFKKEVRSNKGLCDRCSLVLRKNDV
ncbi:MAG: isoleucine--tRNA ligase [Pelagibacterales bacterium]|nr:isoleucine--tRNA ligase [Pelagibacterales bacterium]OUU63316.1 MAG: isoleucine--tRNA ligase [Alphaproteobacteria bacterium TMED62]|tara:strand:- start:12557 stop:15370 length:2814 start_codon:yes stop_codon:yes gene_type:complete